MAESRLIASYLSDLRAAMRGLTDVEDALAEVADHLALGVEHLVRAGAPRAEAEAEVLSRFGPPASIARVFVEESKRGGAVSTTLTRRAGLAAIAAPPLILAGSFGASAASGDQPASAIAIGGIVVAVALLVFALVGLRVRHGGLGVLGRIAFWLAVLAVPIALPFSWAGLVVLAVELGVVVALYGVAMLRAAILPPIPVSLFAFTWPAWAPIAWTITERGGDANKYAILPVLVTLAALMWLGRAMWREPALDARPTGGPLAAA